MLPPQSGHQSQTGAQILDSRRSLATQSQKSCYSNTGVSKFGELHSETLRLKRSVEEGKKLLLSYSEESILQLSHRDAMNSQQAPVFLPSGIQIIVKIYRITDKGSEYKCNMMPKLGSWNKESLFKIVW